MFWDLLHFYPPLGDYGFILFIFLVALPAYFVGRLLGRKIHGQVLSRLEW